MEEWLFPIENEAPSLVRIKCLALGSSACRALQAFVDIYHPSLEDILAVDTDRSCLDELSKQLPTYIFGESLFRGFGAGGDAEWVQKHFSVQDEKIQAFCRQAHIIFILVGLSGGTGSGMLEATLQMVRQSGAFAITIPLMPFSFEGTTKTVRAQTQLDYLQTIADLVIPFYNDFLLQSLSENATAQEAFTYGNRLLGQFLQAFFVTLHSKEKSACGCHLNDFLRHFSQKPSQVIWGIGKGSGEEAVPQAFQAALVNPMLHTQKDRFVPQKACIWLQTPAEVPLKTWKFLNEELQKTFRVSDVSILQSGAICADRVGEVSVLLLLAAGSKNLKTERFRRKKSKKTSEQKDFLSSQLNLEMGISESYWDTPTYLRLGLKLEP